ncbi:MAG: HAMP domain-containing sensor histidine kinase [Ignavibacteriaceae bacterium]|nr:HAMP domain-containing sensor histidine kinase [Ignavibacteriaceae bacterium]
MKTKILNRLSVRLIISISLILFSILSVYTYFIIKNLDEYLTEARYQSANNISDLIKKSTRYGMLLNRREDVHQIIKTLGTEGGVNIIRIYNKQGTIIFSTDTTEIKKKVNVSAEACLACHNSSVPLNKLSINNKIRIYRNSENKRVLGLINPIQNEPDCSNADCHAHSPKVQVLGVLDVVVTLDKLDEIIAKNTKETILTAVLITIVISFFCGLFIALLVNRPIKKLTKGIDEVGKGNLDYKIDVRSKSELGQMAHRFNDMSGRLDEAYKEIKNWSDTLNDKVNEKTEELKNIYSQVNQIEKLASLGKLSATVAHELNNPLEGILTYSKLIAKKLKAVQKDTEHAKIIEFLELISSESARCGKIVKDLLLFSHGEKDVIAKEDLIKIIDKATTVINHHLEMHHVTLEKDFPGEPVELFCNAQKIQQAVMSLLINAIEAMPNGGKITIRVTNEKKQAIIRIIDEGTGISEKDLPHIFEPFFSTKEAATGTGLGLAVVYGIVANHNGHIDVEKTSIQGTTFKITLPQNGHKI